VPVTNKLLIPCRVLDSHFYHLSDSAVPLLSFPSLCPLLTGLFFAGIFSLSQFESRFSPTAVQPLPLLPMYTLLSFPPALPCVRDPPAQRPPPHPLDATFLASLSVRALLSFCFALVQKPTWTVCSYRCAQRWTRASGKPEQGKTTRDVMSHLCVLSFK